ncbi:metallophosphoesterase [Methylopila sp. 73B]|uniref:metallophosphoesterase family protein n=1 Tax=Methylopila sp. 73B TaxID=1120792 RepID=UPI0003634A8D|nr:metallophosphoesterase [Methylopila sp. 73B]
MPPLIDPRRGDVEDDASSTKVWSLASLAGWVLVEISLPKLLLSWLLLVGLPCLLLGVAPLAATAWMSTVSRTALEAFSGVAPFVALAAALIVAGVGGRPAFRLAERSFWSLNALAVQPSFVLCREAMRHFVGRRLSLWFRRDGARVGQVTAVAAAVLMSCLAGAAAWLAWPHSRWIGSWGDLASPLTLLGASFANSVVLFGAYVACGSLAWGAADAAMGQPRTLESHDPEAGGKVWRVAHLSDLHAVGERFGFRIESGRAGPQGNARLAATFEALARAHAAEPLDLVLVTGDMTDAGRSSEWAEFLEALDTLDPALRERMLFIPGNHDVNVVDRSNPARLDLPFSPGKRLRELRALGLLADLQAERVVVAGAKATFDATLSEWLAPHGQALATFVRTGRGKRGRDVSTLWDEAFPMVRLPETPDGLGVILLNSNADTHFSFTNALGMLPAEQERRTTAVIRAHPEASWLVALHHHLVEYPRPTRSLSERIGTALINGSWFLRQLKPAARRVVVMHGHRHVDWTGRCGDLRIVSAPSPVMGRPYFWIQRFGVADGRLTLLKPQRVDLGQPPHVATPPVAKAGEFET